MKGRIHVMIIKQFIAAIFILASMSSCAQNKTDLTSLHLNENAEQLLKETPGVIKGEMFKGKEMISYGVDNKNFTYRGHVPEHIELLSYKGELAGYAFKVYSFDAQQRLLSYLKEEYKNIKKYTSVQGTDYTSVDKGRFVEFRAISKEQFEHGRNAYLSVKRKDFYEAFEKLVEH